MYRPPNKARLSGVLPSQISEHRGIRPLTSRYRPFPLGKRTHPEIPIVAGG